MIRVFKIRDFSDAAMGALQFAYLLLYFYRKNISVSAWVVICVLPLLRLITFLSRSISAGAFESIARIALPPVFNIAFLGGIIYLESVAGSKCSLAPLLAISMAYNIIVGHVQVESFAALVVYTASSPAPGALSHEVIFLMFMISTALFALFSLIYFRSLFKR
jgi:hypothetical protein